MVPANGAYAVTFTLPGLVETRKTVSVVKIRMSKSISQPCMRRPAFRGELAAVGKKNIFNSPVGALRVINGRTDESATNRGVLRAAVESCRDRLGGL